MFVMRLVQFENIFVCFSLYPYSQCYCIVLIMSRALFFYLSFFVSIIVVHTNCVCGFTTVDIYLKQICYHLLHSYLSDLTRDLVENIAEIAWSCK